MTSTSPVVHGPPGKEISAFSLGGKIFGTGLVVIFFIVYVVLRWHLLPAAYGHLESPLAIVFCIAFLIILWSGGIFDRWY
jgi:hypothetical protein